MFVLRLFQMAFYFFQHLHRIIKNQRIFKPDNSNSLRVEEFGTSGIILSAFFCKMACTIQFNSQFVFMTVEINYVMTNAELSEKPLAVLV